MTNLKPSSWIIPTSMAVYVAAVLVYSVRNENDLFWTAFYNVAGAYIGIVGLLCNFKKEKSDVEMKFIIWCTCIRCTLLLAMLAYYIFGFSFPSYFPLCWLAVCSFIALIYKA